ncbi:Scaffold-type E3 ligase [Tulasnella sp. 408]|nr:Scaffold-type E3 ligase [Tulasnella sp. 408]
MDWSLYHDRLRTPMYGATWVMIPPQTDAVRLLEQYSYRVDVAADAYFEGQFVPETHYAPSTEKIVALFEKYQDGEEDEVGLDGTIEFLNDLQLGLEEPVVLALAYEFGSPAVGRWPKSGWIEGMKALQCDSLENLRGAAEKLREKLESQHEYFQKVYSFTFGTLFWLKISAYCVILHETAVDSATQFWSILLPFSIEHGVLGSEGPIAWNERHTQLWFKYLGAREIKGISKDTWGMFLDFVKTADAKFERHDPEGSWPSLIDDFVGYAKEQLANA